MKYALIRDVGGRLARACPDCGREEPPWLAPAPGKTPVAVTCPCGYQYRYTTDPSERMLQILRDLNKQADEQRLERAREAARERRERRGLPTEAERQIEILAERERRAIQLAAQKEQQAQQRGGVGIHPDPEPTKPTKPTKPKETEESPTISPASPIDSRITPPEAPAPPEPEKKHWKIHPEVADRMLRALKPPEERPDPPDAPTLSERRIAFAGALDSHARFLAQREEHARRHFRKILDRVYDRLPEPDEDDWTPVYGKSRHGRAPHAS